MIKTKETIIEEMCDYLKGISVGLKELIQENYNIKQMNPLFHLREVFWLEKKCKGNTGILKLYYELNLCKINNFTLNDIHKIITKFFIAEGKLELFSKFNIKKLYKLFLMDFPEKLRDLIIEVILK